MFEKISEKNFKPKYVSTIANQMESTEMKRIRSDMLQKCREPFLHIRARGKNKFLLNKKKKIKKEKNKKNF